MTNFFTNSLKPELMILVPVLYAAGVLLKKSRVRDFHIPFLLGLFGITLAIAWVMANSTIFTWRAVVMQVFTGITQGILAAAASVYTDQLLKQGGKGQECKKCEMLKKQQADAKEEDSKEEEKDDKKEEP